MHTRYVINAYMYMRVNKGKYRRERHQTNHHRYLVSGSIIGDISLSQIFYIMYIFIRRKHVSLQNPQNLAQELLRERTVWERRKCMPLVPCRPGFESQLQKL